MYNGIGLVTPRGSGTSGHITRNLSHLRPRDDFRSPQDVRDMPVKHRAPDASILDHERKRKIEVQCLELQDELEEKGIDADEVENQVSELRTRLSRQGQATNAQPERGSIKEFQRHELLAAKAVDNDRFSRALGIRRDFVEGESINKERQEELRMQRQMDKERRGEELAERKRQYDEDQERRRVEGDERQARARADRAEQMEKHRMEVESRAKDRENRMREIQAERERDAGRSAPRVRNDLVDSYRPARGTRRSRSPPARGGRRDSSRGRSMSRSISRSRSPPRRRGYNKNSRSRSRSRSLSSSRSRSLSRSRSPPRRRGRARSYSRSASRSRSRSRSPSPRRKRDDSPAVPASRPRNSRSPPPRRARTRSRSPQAPVSDAPAGRAASISGSEDMDVESDAGSN